MPAHTILWRNITMPGHEACRLHGLDSLWHLEGTAVFSCEHKPCLLTYEIVCDPTWRTLSAYIEGWVGHKTVEIQLRKDADHHWWLNEAEVSEVIGCIDLDLNFSPATNLIPIRRLNLAIGEQADITAAWLKFPGFTLEALPQRYQRLEELVYRYESGNGRFTADLKVDPEGFVLDYPGIWQAEEKT